MPSQLHLVLLDERPTGKSSQQEFLESWPLEQSDIGSHSLSLSTGKQIWIDPVERINTRETLLRVAQSAQKPAGDFNHFLSRDIIMLATTLFALTLMPFFVGAMPDAALPVATTVAVSSGSSPTAIPASQCNSGRCFLYDQLDSLVLTIVK